MSRSLNSLKKHIKAQVLALSIPKTGLLADNYFNPKSLGKKPNLTAEELRVRKTFVRLSYNLM